MVRAGQCLSLSFFLLLTLATCVHIGKKSNAKWVNCNSGGSFWVYNLVVVLCWRVVLDFFLKGKD